VNPETVQLTEPKTFSGKKSTKQVTRWPLEAWIKVGCALPQPNPFAVEGFADSRCNFMRSGKYAVGP
jgi:hypothetical protein